MANGNCSRICFQHGDQPSLRDLRQGRHDLPLGHFVDRIDVIQTLGAVAVALMHGVDPQIPGPALRARFAPLADGNWRGPCRLIAGIAFAVSLGVAEAVDLRHRDLGDALEGSLAVFFDTRAAESVWSPGRSSCRGSCPRRPAIPHPLSCIGRRTSCR